MSGDHLYRCSRNYVLVIEVKLYVCTDIVLRKASHRILLVNTVYNC